MREERNVYRILMGKPDGKRPPGRMYLREIGWGSVDWMQLAQDTDRWQVLVNTVINLQVLAPQS
jgi:hypothetical protein